MSSFKWLLKTIAKIVLLGMLVIHLVPVVLILTRLGTYVTRCNSYIHVVSLPKLGTEAGKKSLDNFNSLGYSSSVSYSGLRPIFILERKLEPGILGFATPLPLYCLIVINSDMDAELLETTLMHEYVHCFNYEHVKNPNDLMYPYNNYPFISKESIKRYADEIGKIIN